MDDHMLLTQSSIYPVQDRLRLLDLTLIDFFTKERLSETNMRVKIYLKKIETWIGILPSRLRTMRDLLNEFPKSEVLRSKNVGVKTTGAILGTIAHHGLRFRYESLSDRPTGAFSSDSSDYCDEPEKCF